MTSKANYYSEILAGLNCTKDLQKHCSSCISWNVGLHPKLSISSPFPLISEFHFSVSKLHFSQGLLASVRFSVHRKASKKKPIVVINNFSENQRITVSLEIYNPEPDSSSELSNSFLPLVLTACTKPPISKEGLVWWNTPLQAPGRVQGKGYFHHWRDVKWNKSTSKFPYWLTTEDNGCHLNGCYTFIWRVIWMVVTWVSKKKKKWTKTVLCQHSCAAQSFQIWVIRSYLLIDRIVFQLSHHQITHLSRSLMAFAFNKCTHSWV